MMRYRFANRLTRQERVQLARALQQIPRVSTLRGAEFGAFVDDIANAICFAKAGVPLGRRGPGRPPKVEAHILAHDILRALASRGLRVGHWISPITGTKAVAHQVLAVASRIAGQKSPKDPRRIFRQAKKIKAL
jgi:hypothetical protein